MPISQNKSFSQKENKKKISWTVFNFIFYQEVTLFETNINFKEFEIFIHINC